MGACLEGRGCWGYAASQGGRTALIWAAERGCKDTVELLLDRGAALEAKTGVSQARQLPSGADRVQASRADHAPCWRWGRCHGVLAGLRGASCKWRWWRALRAVVAEDTWHRRAARRR